MRLPEWHGCAWLPLHGGRTNITWKVVSPQRADCLVIKLYQGPARNPLFPNDPTSEAALLTHLAGQFPCPDLIDSFETSSGACNIYSHIPGDAWVGGVGDVATLMRHLHMMPKPKNLRQMPDGSAELDRHTLDILGRCQAGGPLLAMRPSSEIPPVGQHVLLHADIVPGNLIRNADGLFLIDWQCPGYGDPCEDIAVFLSSAMQHLYRGVLLQPHEVEEFFSAYNHPEIAARYRQLAPWYHWRMAAYCLWQSENGRSDYSAALALEIDALQRSINAYPK